MSSSLRGFSKNNNLIENKNDRLSIANLVSNLDGISDDIDLFANNLNNESRLLILVAEVANNKITLDNNTLEKIRLRSSVFTNGDQVELYDLEDNKINSVPLYIKNSNGLDTFSLSTDASLEATYQFTPTSDFYVVRKNSVFVENLNFLGLSTDFFNNNNVLTTQTLTEPVNDISESVLSINELLGTAKFLKKNKIESNQNSITEEVLSTEGNIVISGTVVDSLSPPGVYVIDSNSSVDNISKLRSYSSNINPWSDNGSALETNASSINVGKLLLKNGMLIDFNNPGSVQTISGNVDDDFTHKTKILINGVVYYLCLGA